MSDPDAPVQAVTVFVCGRKCDHVWDGPYVQEFWPNGNLMSESVTCSKCGIDAMSADLMEEP